MKPFFTAGTRAVVEELHDRGAMGDEEYNSRQRWMNGEEIGLRAVCVVMFLAIVASVLRW